MATELAKAYVQIVPSAKGIQGRIQNELNNEMAQAGKSSAGKFVAAFKQAIVAAGIGIAVKEAFSDALKEGGELQQNLGGTEAVFGQFASTIQNQASTAYKNMGMSASDYMATANKMGSLFQGSGLKQQRALDLTSAAMQRAADVASVMGIDTEWAMESIAGAAKGNFTMMDNLGVAMNATTLQAYALEKGMNFEWNTASQAEKAELAMQMFMERTSQYAGNFARESEETWTGSIGAMKSAYQNLMGNLMMGNDLEPSLQALGQTITTFLTGNFLPAVTNIIGGIPTIFFNIIPQIIPAVLQTGTQIISNIAQGIIQGTPQLLMSAYSIAQQIGTGIITNAPAFFESASNIIEQLKIGLQTKMPTILQEGGAMLLNLVMGIVSNLPYLISEAGNLVVQFVSAILSSLPQILQTGTNLLLKLVSGITQNLPKIVSSAASIIAKLVATIAQNLPQILQSGIEIIGKLAAGLVRAIPDLVGKVPQIVRSVASEFTKTDWWSVGRDIISGIAKGISGAASQLWNAAKSVLGSFKDKVLDFFGIHSPSRWGIWVAEMIVKGLGIGTYNGESFLAKRMYSIKSAMEKPFTGDLTYSANGTIEDRGNGYEDLLERLDKILQILEFLIKRDCTINISFGERELIRILRSLGVVFA